MFPLQAQIIALLVSVGLSAFGGYRIGHQLAESKCLKEKEVALIKSVEQVREAQETDKRVVEERQEKERVVTRTITKVQREIIKLPTRDCGLTPDERMSVNTAYCASFPDASSCLSNAVPTGSRASSTE